MEADRMLISHTHPGGTAWASQPDKAVLRHLREIGSPQRSSVVIPVGKGIQVRFNEYQDRVTK